MALTANRHRAASRRRPRTGFLVAGEAWAAIDPVIRSAYVRRFEADVRRVPWRDVAEDAAWSAVLAADVVLLGEFHPLPSAAAIATELIARWCAAGREVLLALEMVHGRDQRALDAFLAGDIGEMELRRAIRWREEWGYPWSAARALLRTARVLDVPVLGLDIAPRGGPRDLARRDGVAARRIAHAIASAPGTRVAVLFGEAHLASTHLPAALGAVGPRDLAVARVFHDLEHLAAPESGAPRWLAAAPLTFARQALPPAARVRALEATWRRWARDVAAPGEVDYAHLVHTLIDAQAAVLGLDTRRVARGPARWLADELPRVFGPGEVRDAAHALAHSGRAPAVARDLLAAAHRECVLVDARANAVVIADPGLGPIALATARWLGAALRAPSGASLAGPAAGIDGQVAADALALALALLVDPALDVARPGIAKKTVVLAASLARRLRARQIAPARLRAWFRAPLEDPAAGTHLLARLRDAATRTPSRAPRGRAPR